MDRKRGKKEEKRKKKEKKSLVKTLVKKFRLRHKSAMGKRIQLKY